MNKLDCEKNYWERWKDYNQDKFFWKLFMKLIDKDHQKQKIREREEQSIK